jgi:hypothetical protein
MENVLFLHINIIFQSWLWRGAGANALNASGVYVMNSVFNSMSFSEDAGGNFIENSY